MMTRKFPAGILDHIRANQSRYLGAVFSIIKAWHDAGKPRTTETRHDFRRWATTLDWIVQHLLHCPPLLDGHRETQRRMATAALTWLRDVALAVAQAGKLGEWLRTYEILDVAEAAGLEIPGAGEDTNLDDDASRTKVLRVIGKKLSGCFRDDQTTIDDVMILRQQSGISRWRTSTVLRPLWMHRSRNSCRLRFPEPADAQTRELTATFNVQESTLVVRRVLTFAAVGSRGDRGRRHTCFDQSESNPSY